MIKNILRTHFPLASGAFSQTFIAHNVETFELYVEKVLSLKLQNFGSKIFVDRKYRSKIFSDVRAMFLDEIELMHRIKHKNIIKVVATRKGNYPSIIMEYAGENLSKLCINARFSKDDIIKFLVDISSAIKYLHSQNIAHLDVSPRNIFFNTSNNDFVLGDFGMAKKISIDPRLNKYTGDLFCNAQNAPPEFIKNRTYSLESDIWMFGFSLFSLLMSGSVQSWSQRLFDTLESINYNFDTILRESYWANDVFLKEILAITLVSNPQKRANINEIYEKIINQFPQFEYKPNCAIVKDNTGNKKVLSYNLAGLIEKLNNFNRKGFNEYTLEDINDYQFYNNLFLTYYPNYRDVYANILIHLTLAHLFSGNIFPTEDIKKNYQHFLQQFINSFPPYLANFNLFITKKILENQEDTYKIRTKYFLDVINNVLNQMLLNNSFLIIGQISVDSKSGKKKLELEPLINNPDYCKNIYLLEIKDFSEFKFNKALKVEDIIYNETDDSFSLKLSKSKNIPPYFILVPENVIRPKLNYYKINSEYRNFGFFSTYNNVLNMSFNDNITVMMRFKNRMLATGCKDKIILNSESNFVHYTSSKIKIEEPLQIITDKYDTLYEAI